MGTVHGFEVWGLGGSGMGATRDALHVSCLILFKQD